ncbi:AI-2E family transporter [Flindersiella endophytica]
MTDKPEQSETPSKPDPGAAAAPSDQAADTGTGSGSGGVDGSAPADAGGGEPTAGVGPYGSLGVAGRRLSRTSPFYLGFVGTIGVLTAWLLGNALASTRSVLVLLIVGMYLAIALNPLVEWFVRHRVKRGLAVFAVVIGALALFGLMALAIIPVVTEQVTALVQQVPDWLAQLQRNPDIQQLDDRYDIIGKIEDYVASGDLAAGLFGGILGFGKIVFGAVFSAFTVLVLTLYFLGSLPKITHAVYQMVPRSRRDRVSRLSDKILEQIGRYVGGQLLVAAVAGTMTFLFLTIFAGPLRGYALALAIAVAVLGLIPLVGGLVSSVLVIALAFLTGGLSTGIICLVYYVIYQQVENYLIYPRIMQRSVSVPGMIVVVAALVGGSILGMVGALLAVPTAAAIMLIMREVVIPRQERA